MENVAETGTKKYLDMDIYTAASLGDIEYFKEYLKRDSNNNENLRKLSISNQSGWTVLMYACFGGHNELIKLLKQHISTDIVETYGPSLLVLAITGGDIETVKLVFKLKYLEVHDHLGWTPLFHAVYFGKEQAVMFLLSCGANINAVDFQNQTPLMIAIKHGMEQFVSLLLKSNTNLRVVSNKNETAFTLAQKTNNPTIMNMLEHHNQRNTYFTPTRPCETILNPDAEEFVSSSPVFGTQSLNRPSFIQSSSSFFATKFKKPLNLKINKPNIFSPNIKTTPSPLSTRKLDFDLYTNSNKIPHSPCLKQNVSVCKFGCSVGSPNTIDFLPPDREVRNVKEFLKSLDLDKYWPVFQSEEIDFETLLTLSEDNLKEIGITLMGPRKKLCFAIQQIQKKKRLEWV